MRGDASKPRPSSNLLVPLLSSCKEQGRPPALGRQDLPPNGERRFPRPKLGKTFQFDSIRASGCRQPLELNRQTFGPVPSPSNWRGEGKTTFRSRAGRFFLPLHANDLFGRSYRLKMGVHVNRLCVNRALGPGRSGPYAYTPQEYVATSQPSRVSDDSTPQSPSKRVCERTVLKLEGSEIWLSLRRRNPQSGAYTRLWCPTKPLHVRGSSYSVT